MPLPEQPPPAELTSLPHWVGWRYEQRNGGRPTKVPYNLQSGRPASSTEPSTWVDYSLIVEAGLPEGYDGVGFVFTRETGITGIDFDDCLDDSGAMKPWAAHILKHFSATYSETSPSGTGVKVWAQGNIPDGGKGLKVYLTADGFRTREGAPDVDGAIEVYDQGRYFAVTGRARGPVSLAECQAQISELCRMLRGLPERNGGTAAAGKSEAGPVAAGGRHGFLLTLGGRFRNQGASREVVLSALRAANKESCQPPKPDFEVIGIADWLMTKEPGYRLTRKDFEATEPGYVPPAEKSLDDRVKAVIEAKDVSLAYTAEFIDACVEAGDAAAFTARQALKKEFGKEFVLKGVEGAWDVRYKRAADRARHAAAKGEPLTWRDSLLLSEKGAVLACYENAALFAENSVEWHGVLGYNEFTGGHVVLEKAPHPVTAKPGAEIEDHFDTEVTRWFERAGCMVKPEVARRTVDRMARLNAFHPVRDYLSGLPPWDGEKRIDCWLFDYCKVSRRRVNERDEEIFNTFASEAGAKFLISAVARVFEPGCKADHVLMLEGKTGIGKSTAAKALAGEEFFTDQLSDLGSKDASMQVRGIWIAEMADIHALARSDREKAKAFITQTFERFRLPYGARLTKFQRQCVFIGTTESSEWNNDERGARRFWPVLCEGKIDTEGLLRDRDQIWAEALARYRDGDRWYLHLENTVKEAEEEQSDRYAVDPWQEKVMAYACRSKTGVGLQEVLSHGLGMDIDRQGRAESNRVAACLRFARWERRQVREGRNRYWRYFPPEGAQLPLTESS